MQRWFSCLLESTLWRGCAVAFYEFNFFSLSDKHWLPYGTFCWAQCASCQVPIWMTNQRRDFMSVQMNSPSLSISALFALAAAWRKNNSHCVLQLRAGRGLLGRSGIEEVVSYAAALCGCSKLHVGEPCAGGGMVPGRGMRRNQHQPSLQTQCRSKARFYWHYEAQWIYSIKRDDTG